jgi:hypothetical protein
MDGILKNAAIPLWLRVPGATVPITGAPPPYERLPGMTEWAPREMVEDVAKGLRGGQDVEGIAQQQSRKGLLGNAAMAGLTGGFGGVLGGRLVGGEQAWEPFKGVLAKGLNREGLSSLKGLRWPMAVLPLAGAGLGVGLAAKNWAEQAPHRQKQTYDVARGLLAERVLQRDSLRQAMGRELQSLRGIPHQSANELPPLVISTGD